MAKKKNNVAECKFCLGAIPIGRRDDLTVVYSVECCFPTLRSQYGVHLETDDLPSTMVYHQDTCMSCENFKL